MNLATALLLSLCPAPDDDGLDKLSTTAMVELYKNTKHWALKSIALLGLGKKWHPVGAEMILEAFKDKDRRVQAYAMEALSLTDPETLKCVLSKELVENLVTKQMAVNHVMYRERVLKVLGTIAPSDAKTASQMSSWWNKAKKDYAPAEWKPGGSSPGEKSGGTVAEKFVRRAFEMSEVGIEVVFCLDTTGSMQVVIDAVRDALKDIFVIIQGVSPKFKLGLVHYKDFDDWKEGAKVLVPLTNNVDEMIKKLSRTPADGGGDLPERVEKGLEVALDQKQMGWVKESHKAIVVIGDAPCHNDAYAKAIELVKGAKDKPFGENPPDVATGGGGETKKVTRPFITSAIATGADALNPTAEQHFKGIADAGGGMYGTLVTSKADKDATEKVVTQILQMSFGKEWEKEVNAFISVFLEYRKKGFFP